MDGQPLLARMSVLARRFCSQVVVCGRDPGHLSPGLPWFLDDTPGLGPLGGIITTLKRINASCLMLSCDLPHLDAATVEKLLDAWRTRPPGTMLTTFLQQETGFIEALVAVWEPQALPLLLAANEKGCRKLSRTIPAALTHCVPYSLQDAHPFFNVNTPEDLDKMRF